MLKGTLEGCVLEIIGGEETCGYAITRRLNELRGGAAAQVLRAQRRRTRTDEK